ncbi:hypothetical protein D6789_02525, partial [Candidatus Woesearchaeota archaeon]
LSFLMTRIVILAGISQRRETNTWFYWNPFCKTKLDTNKAAIELNGKPLIQHSCEAYLEAGLAPEYWGPRRLLEPLLTSEQRRATRLIDMENSLGDKLARLGGLEGRIHVATVDLVPRQDDLAAALAVAQEHPHADAIAYAINATSLVALGFRKHLAHKIYLVDNGHGKDYVAFPQFWTFSPERTRLGWISRATRTVYSMRGWGLLLTPFYLPKLIRQLRRDDSGKRMLELKEEELMRTIRGLMSNRWYIPGKPPTYEKIASIIAYGMRDREHARIHVARNLDAPSLAMDIDWEHEAPIVERYLAASPPHRRGK